MKNIKILLKILLLVTIVIKIRLIFVYNLYRLIPEFPHLLIETKSQLDKLFPFLEIKNIELLQVTPTTAQQYVDSIAFTIQYQDGNGDLGNADPDIPSIKLIDNRDPGLLIFNYHLSPRTPEGSELAIEGELTIVLANSILLDDSNQTEATNYFFDLYY